MKQHLISFKEFEDSYAETSNYDPPWAAVIPQDGDKIWYYVKAQFNKAPNWGHNFKKQEDENRFVGLRENLNETKKSELIKKSLSSRAKKAEVVEVKFSKKKNVDDIVEISFSSKDLNSKNKKSWEQKIQLLDLKYDNLDESEIEKSLKSSLKVYCECPDFLFKGFKYIATKNEYGIEEENREPNVNNPRQEGTVCKHLYAVLNKLNDFVKDIKG